MIVASAAALIAGYTLLYAGVRGIYWQDPWKLLITWFTGGSTKALPKQP